MLITIGIYLENFIVLQRLNLITLKGFPLFAVFGTNIHTGKAGRFIIEYPLVVFLPDDQEKNEVFRCKRQRPVPGIVVVRSCLQSWLTAARDRSFPVHHFNRAARTAQHRQRRGIEHGRRRPISPETGSPILLFCHQAGSHNVFFLSGIAKNVTGGYIINLIIIHGVA